MFLIFMCLNENYNSFVYIIKINKYTAAGGRRTISNVTDYNFLYFMY